MSETQKKRWLDPEYREKMLEARKGRPHKPFKEETKRKMSETAKERAKDPEVRRKRSEAARNRPRVKIKLSDGTIIERTKPNIVRDYVNKGKKFEYVD